MERSNRSFEPESNSSPPSSLLVRSLPPPPCSPPTFLRDLLRSDDVLTRFFDAIEMFGNFVSNIISCSLLCNSFCTLRLLYDANYEELCVVGQRMAREEEQYFVESKFSDLTARSSVDKGASLAARILSQVYRLAETRIEQRGFVSRRINCPKENISSIPSLQSSLNPDSRIPLDDLRRTTQKNLLRILDHSPNQFLTRGNRID